MAYVCVRECACVYRHANTHTQNMQTIALAGASDAHAAQFLDSKTIAAAIDDKVVLWDIETAQVCHSFRIYLLYIVT